MELAPPTAIAGGGGGAGVGGGGPAPFLLKTYEMVDDSKTDEIVSWSSTNNSFVVWNPPEFARILLPTYFKHNNFSSFIRQLNTYGFRKIDPEKWEFANEEFVKDQKHLLKNIHRRKPIHSHSNPPGSSVDPERAAFVEEIERLSHEKAKFEGNILAFEQQSSSAKAQGEEWTQRVDSLEKRQDKLLSYLEKALQNSNFVESLAKKIESMEFSAYSKKRRLPQDDHTKTPENSFLENHSSSRPEFGSVINQDFSNKLRLELSPAVSDINLISHSTHSSYEDGASIYRRISEGDPKDAHARTSVLLFAPETLELSDTGTSYTFKVDPTHLRKMPANESPGLHSLQQNFSSSEEGDGHISCHLNLTLASSPMQVNKSPYSNGPPQLAQEVGKSPELWFNDGGKESNMATSPKSRSFVDEDTTLSSSREAPNNNQGHAAAPPRVNDVFWEQFLTERPGSSDTEEASSNYRASTNEDQEDRRLGFGLSRNAKINGQLSL